MISARFYTLPLIATIVVWLWILAMVFLMPR
jgi:hypothetical protein